MEFKTLRPEAGKGTTRFAQDARGGVAIMFGLSIVPLMLFAGVAIDYSRASAEHSALQHALDATVLSLAHEPVNTPISVMNAKAHKVFAVNFQGHGKTAPTLNITVSRPRLTLSGSTTIPTSLMALAGKTEMTVSGLSQVAFGNAKLEIALALDNTGSMAQSGKIQALKTSVNNLITTIEKATRNRGDSKMAIVPFNTQVNIGTGYKTAPWLRYDTTIENTNFHGSSPTPPTALTWTGCLTDRDQAYDTDSVGPFSTASNYVAANCEFAGLAAAKPLTTDLESIRRVANSMAPTGATNVTIGLTHGLAMLRPDNPLGANASSGIDILKFLILLTDGNNTENRFVGDGMDFNADAPKVDDRLKQACQTAKSQSIEVFTIRVIDGNEPLLRDCASRAKNYFAVSNASQLQGVFDQIAGQIAYSRIRLLK